MKLGVEGAVAVDVDMGVDVVEVEVDLLETLLTMRMPLATTMDSLVGTDQLKREMLGGKLRGVALVGLVVLSGVVAVVVLTMEMLLKGNVHGGHMNATVGLDVG